MYLKKNKTKKVDKVDNLRVVINHSTITATAESSITEVNSSTFISLFSHLK